MDDNLLMARSMAVGPMRRHVRTTHGVSSGAYTEEKGRPSFGGEVQGKADCLALFTQQSSIVLQAHRDIAPGLEIWRCTGERSIKHNNISYLDDNDGHVSAPQGVKNPTLYAMEANRKSSTAWNRLVQLTGGALALHKTEWRALVWKTEKGRLVLERDTDERMVLEDGLGGHAEIEYKAPDEPNGGLGYRICPDGNQSHAYQDMKGSTDEYCRNIRSSHTNERETWSALDGRLVPKLAYKMQLTYVDEEKSDKIDTVIRDSMLPRMQMNRHTPKAVVHGPMEYGGMKIMDVYLMQDQL